MKKILFFGLLLIFASCLQKKVVPMPDLIDTEKQILEEIKHNLKLQLK